MCDLLFLKTIDKLPDQILKTYTTHESRRRVKFVVIDDQGIGADLKQVLQNNGFILEELSDVSSVTQVKGYHVVLCDIQGVGNGISPDFEGAGVVKAIRDEYPTKYIISFTGSSVDRKYNAYLKYADSSIPKDASKADWIDELGIAVRNTLDPKLKWKKIRSYLISRDIPTKMILRIEDNFVRSMLDDSIKFPSEKIIKGVAPEIAKILKDIVIPIASVLL